MPEQQLIKNKLAVGLGMLLPSQVVATERNFEQELMISRPKVLFL